MVLFNNSCMVHFKKIENLSSKVTNVVLVQIKMISPYKFHISREKEFGTFFFSHHYRHFGQQDTSEKDMSIQ